MPPTFMLENDINQQSSEKTEPDAMEESHRWEDSVDARLWRAKEDGLINEHEYFTWTLGEKEDWLSGHEEY